MGLLARLAPLTSIVARRPDGDRLQLGAHQLSVALRILTGGVLCTSGVLKFVNPQGLAKGAPNVRTLLKGSHRTHWVSASPGKARPWFSLCFWCQSQNGRCDSYLHIGAFQLSRYDSGCSRSHRGLWRLPCYSGNRADRHRLCHKKWAYWFCL